MADQSNQNQCAHPNCDCLVTKDEKYCSPHCEAAPETEVMCGCGHPACQTATSVESGRVARV